MRDELKLRLILRFASAHGAIITTIMLVEDKSEVKVVKSTIMDNRE